MCTHCMAGLREACSHIAALLFTAQTNTEQKSQCACTTFPCSWLLPSFSFADISKIYFHLLNRSANAWWKVPKFIVLLVMSYSSKLKRDRVSLVSKPSEEVLDFFFKGIVIVLLFCHWLLTIMRLTYLYMKQGRFKWAQVVHLKESGITRSATLLKRENVTLYK